ncbi:MAG: sodium/solute symporter [Xanthomonadales bacterium]|nr:sodium/solute symporter [Xanthomonadales bacterium]
MKEFGALNWGILLAYLVGNLVLGFFLSKRVSTAEHYYLGQRTTPWWVIGMSVVATYIGAMAFLGGPAWAYTEGFSVIFIHINYPIAIFVVITVFLPFFYRSGVASIYDYLERRFGLTSRTVMSSVFLFGNAAYSGIMLYTTALVLEFITGIPVIDAILVVAVVAVTYTMLGGIAAVIWTDLAQSAILFLGALITVFLLVGELPDGLFGTLAELKAQGRTEPFEFSPDPAKVGTIWTGVIAMSIYHVVVYGVNQMMVQRTLAAKTLGDAKKAYMLMAYLAFLIFVLFFGMGVLFYAYYGGRVFENENLVVLEFVASIGFPGLMGLVTAAIVAAAMSSLDSALNSMATVTTLDFYEKFFRKDGSPEHYLKASRWFTLLWAVLMVVPAIIFSKSGGSVLEVLSKVGSFFVGAKLAMFGLGFYSKHTTERGLLIGVAAGFLSLWYVEANLDLAWPWYCALGGLVSIVVAWVSSVLIDGFSAGWHEYTVPGQKAAFRRQGLAEMEDGWYVVPGRVDRASYGLLVYFLFCLAALWFLHELI